MKIFRPKEPLRFKSYTENSHHFFYFDHIDEKEFYKEVLDDLIINCALSCIKNKGDSTLRKKCELKIPTENLVTPPVLLKSWGILQEEGKKEENFGLLCLELFWFEQFEDPNRVYYICKKREFLEVEEFNLNKDIESIEDINSDIPYKEKILERYNSKREHVLSKLKEAGSPRLMIEIVGQFVYVYVNTDMSKNSYTLYIIPRNFNVYEFVSKKTEKHKKPYLEGWNFKMYDYYCALEAAISEINELPKEHQAKIITALIRFFQGDHYDYTPELEITQ